MPDSETDFSTDLTDIYQGILKDDVNLLQKGVDNRANVNLSFKGDSKLQHIGMTPLALASALNKLQAVKFLLDNDANVNDTFASLRTTALMTASFHGHSAIVDLLIQRGANVQAIDLQGSTALGYAFGGSRSVEVIQLLLSSGVNINQKNMLGMNALLLVAGYGNDKLVKMVLDAGAEPNSINDFGHSALHLVIVGKRSQLKKLFLEAGGGGAGGKLVMDNFNNLKCAEVALKDWAAKHRNLPVDSKKLEKAASLMSNIGSKMQRTFLKISDDSDQEVMKQRVEAVWLYRQEKLLVTKKNSKKTGKLESFLTCGGKSKKEDDAYTSQPYLSAPSRAVKKINTEKDREIAELREKFAKILCMIVDAGCQVEITEKTFGMTALDMAILLEDVESTGVLVSKGADPEHLLKMFALSDMHEAITSGDKKLVDKLIAYDTDLDINCPFSSFNVDSKIQDDEDAGNIILSDGVTPLTVAVQMPDDDGHAVKIVKTLIKNKADVNKMGPGETTPIMEAARLGNVNMCELLVTNGADVNLPCPRYNEATPIIIAAIFNRAEVASFLSDNKAKLDLETSDKRCALTEAFRNDNTKIVETILRGSLGQSFANKNSFTYGMIVKYQRPDKNMNTILKLISEELKQQDETRKSNELANKKKLQYANSFSRQQSEAYKDRNKNTSDNNNNSNNSENINNNNNNLLNVKNNRNNNVVDALTNNIPDNNIKTRKSYSNDKQLSNDGLTSNNNKVPTKKVDIGELNTFPTNNFADLKHTVSSKIPQIPTNSNEIVKNTLESEPFKSSMTSFKTSLESNKNQLYEETASKVRNAFDQNEKKIHEKFSNSISNTGNKFNTVIQKPLEDYVDYAATTAAALPAEKVIGDFRENAVNWDKKIGSTQQQQREEQRLTTKHLYHDQQEGLQQQEYNQQRHHHQQQQHHPQLLQHSQQMQQQRNYQNTNNDSRSYQDSQNEEWEDETGFQEHYYPASSFDTEEMGLMTTPILGRSTQVRSNYAQTDTYLRDVLKTGNAPRFSPRTALNYMRPINDEDEDGNEDNDGVKSSNTRYNVTSSQATKM